MAGFAWPSRCCTSVIGAPLAIMAEAQLWRSVWKVTRRNFARERAAGKIASVASWPRSEIRARPHFPSLPTFPGAFLPRAL